MYCLHVIVYNKTVFIVCRHSGIFLIGPRVKQSYLPQADGASAFASQNFLAVDRCTPVWQGCRCGCGQVYACCSETYPDVTFTIHMTRRSLFYIINLIFPCLLIYAVSFLGFFLPVESGEKVNLEITILLALVVFLLIVGETLPPTPDAIPVLGQLRRAAIQNAGLDNDGSNSQAGNTTGLGIEVRRLIARFYFTPRYRLHCSINDIHSSWLRRDV